MEKFEKIAKVTVEIPEEGIEKFIEKLFELSQSCITKHYPQSFNGMKERAKNIRKAAIYMNSIERLIEELESLEKLNSGELKQELVDKLSQC